MHRGGGSFCPLISQPLSASRVTCSGDHFVPGPCGAPCRAALGLLSFRAPLGVPASPLLPHVSAGSPLRWQREGLPVSPGNGRSRGRRPVSWVPRGARESSSDRGHAPPASGVPRERALPSQRPFSFCHCSSVHLRASTPLLSLTCEKMSLWEEGSGRTSEMCVGETGASARRSEFRML